MISEPFSMNGSALVWILFGGPILSPNPSALLRPRTTRTYPYFAIDLKSSTLRFKCSHLVTTIPAPGVAAPPGALTFSPLPLPERLIIPPFTP